jgi:polar amino acid transport system permease protein
MYWHWDFVWDILPRLLDGLVTTVVATLVGSVIGLSLGLVLTFIQFRGPRPLAGLAQAYVVLIRGTPFLIQLYFLFYVLPDFGLVMSPLQTGAIGLGITFSTYFSETFRAGLESVPQGQWEAATALNYTTMRTWRKVALPQALRPILPALGNYVNQMFKVSALLATIAVQDMFGAASTIGNSVFRYLEPMTVVGVLYLVISVPVSLLIRRLQRAEGRPINLRSTQSGASVR